MNPFLVFFYCFAEVPVIAVVLVTAGVVVAGGDVVAGVVDVVDAAGVAAGVDGGIEVDFEFGIDVEVTTFDIDEIEVDELEVGEEVVGEETVDSANEVVIEDAGREGPGSVVVVAGVEVVGIDAFERYIVVEAGIEDYVEAAWEKRW